jgi:hypothetical protein
MSARVSLSQQKLGRCKINFFPLVNKSIGETEKNLPAPIMKSFRR